MAISSSAIVMLMLLVLLLLILTIIAVVALSRHSIGIGNIVISRAVVFKRVGEPYGLFMRLLRLFLFLVEVLL